MKKEHNTRVDTCFEIPAKAQEILEPFDNVERISVSVSKAAKMLDLSERHVWTLIKEEEIRSRKSRGRVIVSVKSLHKYVDGEEVNDGE